MSDATAANEEGAAEQVAQASFEEFGPPFSAIMQRYPSTPLAPGTLLHTAPIGLLVTGSKIDLGSPDWMRRAIGIAFLPAALPFAGGVSGGTPPAVAGAVAFAVLWAPAGTVLGYLGGKWSESSWEPCRQVLQESLSKFDPIGAIATKLNAALNKAGVPTLEMGKDAGVGAEASEAKAILDAQIHRVVLRLCPTSLLSSTLCLDVVTRARLFEKATQTYIYDKMFIYSASEATTRELQPYEVSVTGSTTAATSRALGAYCGEGGGELLQTDLSNALDATVNQIVHELGLTVE